MSKVLTSPRSKQVLAAILLSGLTLVAFWPILGNDFINLDDRTYVENNDNIKEGFTPAALAWAFTTGHASNWHPLTWLSHILDWKLFGPDARGHHLTSLLLHIANVLLLFLVLERMTGSMVRSTFVAALFAVHPLHVESVAWVAERKDVLSTLLWLLAMLAYIRYVKKRSLANYILVAAALALGLAAKPMLVTLPLVLLLLDYWPLKRLEAGEGLWSLLREKIVLFVLAAASGVVTLIVQQSGEAIRSLELLSPAVRIGNAIVSYVTYLWKMLWPRGLAIYYPHPAELPSPALLAGALLALGVITALAIRERERRPFLIVGWLWFLVTLLPVIGLVQVGSQALADRYTYVPLIGIFIALAWVVRRAERPVAAIGVVLVVLLAAGTFQQATYWRDSETLFRHTLDVTEKNAVAHNSLGLALAGKGRLHEAAAEYEAALASHPYFAQAHANLAVVLADLERFAEAAEHNAAALRVRPDSAKLHINMGNALKNLGRFEEAHAHYAAAIRLDGESAEVCYNMGLAFAKQGRLEEAVRSYARGLELDPADARMHNNIGNVLARLGRLDEAIAHLEQAIGLMPGYAKAHANLASVLFFAGRYGDAWAEVERARRLGFEPPQQLVQSLSEKMRDPQQPE